MPLHSGAYAFGISRLHTFGRVLNKTDRTEPHVRRAHIIKQKRITINENIRNNLISLFCCY